MATVEPIGGGNAVPKNQNNIDLKLEGTPFQKGEIIYLPDEFRNNAVEGEGGKTGASITQSGTAGKPPGEKGEELDPGMHSEQLSGKSPDEWWSVTDAMTMSAVVLVFAVFVLGAFAWFFRGVKNEEKVIDSYLITLIILSSLFLIVAGYNKDQVTPLVGLFGTIAGYILGKRSGS